MYVDSARKYILPARSIIFPAFFEEGFRPRRRFFPWLIATSPVVSSVAVVRAIHNEVSKPMVSLLLQRAAQIYG